MKEGLSFKRVSLVVLTAAVVCTLLLLSWPRLQASIRFLPVDTAISNYWKDNEFNYKQFNGLVRQAREAIALHDHYRYWDGLSQLYLLGGQDSERSFWQRREALENSISAAREAVLRAPAKPRAWLRIARAAEFLGQPPDQVIPALKMSILTGRVEPTLMLVRLELGLRQMAHLDAEGLSLLRDQTILTWANQQRAMIKQIKTGSISPVLLRELLALQRADILAEMETHFAQ